MTASTAKNNVWKIMDTQTGLFWSGYQAECSHTVGTRFERQASLDDVVKRIIHKHKGFPPHWEVQKVELSETVNKRMDSLDTFIDALIESDFSHLLSDRGCGSAKAGSKLFRRLRLDETFEKWPFIGLRRPAYQNSWPKFSGAMRDLSIVKARMKAFENGWVMFADKDAVMAAKLADTMDHVFDITDLRADYAKRIHVPVDTV